ncbi:gustatory receptor 5a for trehalose-like isoform X2 [Zootermopsis nevadensis]|uniref:Gustatory receptor n=1 Tax=Zootermopsis nevadensis TaxID=136037 RepID=A0A067QYS5_ZOONE|nr:gustatory receptor 5a for trehalose-like isoform X2 [Zootermopsis nevadensis]KDR10131.1 hypothetical protein L798_15160 [Zootermopsis nevadensis]
MSGANNSFQRALCPLLVAGQCFALMPVSGLTGYDASTLQFRWLSPRVAYTFLSLVGIFCHLCVCVRELVVADHITYSACAPPIFFAVTFLATCFYLRLATKWPDLVSKWQTVEQTMLKDYGYPRNFERRCKFCAAFMLTASTVEHLMALYSCLLRALPRSTGGLDVVRAFYTSWFEQAFKMTEYALWKSLLLQLSNFLATFTWSYMDMYVTLVSMALTEKFLQFGEGLRAVRGKAAPLKFWREARQLYDNLCCLTRTVDEHISHLVLLCLASDLYFICLQLFNSLKNVKTLYGYIYFFYSFGYLLFRASSMCFCAAAVNEVSQKPRDVLYAVPAGTYNAEVERFIDRVTTDEVALTGFRLITLNRRLILTIVGSIVTYELLLVQQGNGQGSFSEELEYAANITIM